MMMAQVCGLEIGEFIHTLGDAHIYLNHMTKLMNSYQAKRNLPNIKINPILRIFLI